MAKKQSGVLSIDFSKEEESGSGLRVHWPEGDYHVKILKAESVRSSEKDTPGLKLTFKVIDGKKKGKKFEDTLWLTPKSLVRVRLLLEAVGVKVPKSAVKLPLKKLIGKTLWVELEDEEGRDGYDDRSRVAFRGFTSEDDFEGEDTDDEEDDEDDEDVDDEEEDDDEDDEDEEDDEEDDDEEEEEQPKKKAKARKKPAAKKKSKAKSKKKAKDDDDDEDEDLEELDLDDL